MKINGLLDKARWESIPCECGTEVMNSFPIKECLHCKFEQCWQSVPQKDFKINEPELKNGEPTGKTITREIKTINLVRGSRFEDVVGWNF